MTGPVIVTATDADLCRPMEGLALSVATRRQHADTPIVCFDPGLRPEQANHLAGHHASVTPTEKPLGIPRHEGIQPYMLGQACRPFLPDLRPGHETYVWLDADTRVRQDDGLDALLSATRHGLAACCPEIHAACPPQV